jgi:hypothetical protein
LCRREVTRPAGTDCPAGERLSSNLPAGLFWEFEMKARQKLVANLVDLLGGTAAVAREFDVVPSAVSNWKRVGRFPARTYVHIVHKLQGKGIFPPSYLWSMK